MARWKLLAGHYLDVPGTEWEYKEQPLGAKGNARTSRKVLKVPLLLVPADPADWTHPELEAIIVAYDDGKQDQRDLIFTGKPTPDMQPLDEDAKAISASLSGEWSNPIEDVDSDKHYTERLIESFQQSMAELATGQGGAVSTGGVPPEAFQEMQKQVAELLTQNQSLLQMLAQALVPRPVEQPPQAATSDLRR